MGKKVVILFLGIFLISFSTASIYDDCSIYGNCFEATTETEVTNIFTNNTNHSNSTDYWVTDIGAAGTINSTQFDINGDTLTLDESWLEALGNKIWCALTGCTMTGDINMSGNNITDVGTITADFFIGDGSGLTGVASTGDSTNNSFHVYINGSAYNNVNYNITDGDVDDVEYTIVPGKKFIFGDTYT